ncbi:MAG: bifunctional folylpolyglutamate synthase/ dihydrofolate synthase [Thermodesulfobacteriota bacterium]
MPQPAFPDFASLAAHLDRLGMFHMDLGLDRTRRALAALGLGRPPFAVAHVVGTNGKGSTSLYLAELARAHGLRAGLYSSPHFVSVRERIRVDGRFLSEAAWARLGSEVQAAAGDLGLTYFEFITVLAVLGFARAGVQLAVMEAGLGGRYDAVSALAKDHGDLTLFTPIGLDHTAVLGPTVARIAADKAGAMAGGSLALTGTQDPAALAELEQAAAAADAPLCRVSEALDAWPRAGAVLDGLELAMPGPHQRDNAALALAGFFLLSGRLGVKPRSEACAAALAGARLAGRLQRVPGEPEIWLDGAHNPPALETLAAALAGLGVRPTALVFACLKDKDLDAIRPLVLGLATGPVLTPELPGAGERARPAAELAAALGPRARPAADVAQALESAARAGGPVLVAGSLYLLAEFFSLRPELLDFSGEDFPLP